MNPFWNSGDRPPFQQRLAMYPKRREDKNGAGINSMTYQEAKRNDLQDTFQGEHHGEGDIQVLQGQFIGTGSRVVLPGREKRKESNP